jgi:hypothetical protein
MLLAWSACLRFAGLRQREPDLIDEYVPRAMRYKAGGDSAWTRACEL